MSHIRMSVLIFFVGGGFFVGCSTPERAETPEQIGQVMVNKDSTYAYLYALDFFKKEDWKKAEEEFYSFLHAYQSSRYYLAGWIAYGETLQHLEKWEESVEAFRKVISRVRFVKPELRERALVSLSLSYEMLSQDEKALAALFDALLVRKNDQGVRRKILIPARIATIYARLSNKREAERYARLANMAIRDVIERSLESEQHRRYLADLLFRMGRNPVGQREVKNTLDVILGLQMSQEFLLQSLETGVSPFPEKVREELVSAYTRIWNRFQSGEDTKLKEKWAIAILDTMDRLNTSRSVSLPESAQKPMNEIIERLNQLESQIFSWIATNAISVTRTSEDQTRAGLKREGRIIDESELRKGRRKPYKLIDLDEELSGDPNL